MADNVVRLKPPRPCPICGKPSRQEFHPFCSARCADVDLNRWLSGTYRIPAEPVEDAKSESAPNEDEDEEE